ncbi:MAG TPA: TIGR03915 family putative DNA repair protein, partial [Beijerinckiaceae bacterium]
MNAPATLPVRRVALAGPTDFAGFRLAARLLLSHGVQPRRVAFEADGAQDLFGEAEPAALLAREAPGGRPPPRVPRAFLDEAGAAALHVEAGRYDLLYRLLWRLGDEPRLLALASDPDVVRLAELAKAVRRDIHKMHAFVRFRRVEGEAEETFVAWYEPDHHVVEAAAPFFAKRFAAMRWAILTPRRRVSWDGERLAFAAGADASQAPSDDALEGLWRSYYGSVFNPARVNPDAMRAEMPKRFWRNLPEAALMPDLIASAPRRPAEMIAAAPPRPA